MFHKKYKKKAHIYSVDSFHIFFLFFINLHSLFFLYTMGFSNSYIIYRGLFVFLPNTQSNLLCFSLLPSLDFFLFLFFLSLYAFIFLRVGSFPRRTVGKCLKAFTLWLRVHFMVQALKEISHKVKQATLIIFLFFFFFSSSFAALYPPNT